MSQLIEFLRQGSGTDSSFQNAAQWFMESQNVDSCEILTVGSGGALVVRGSTSMSDAVGRLRLAKGTGVTGLAQEQFEPIVIEDNLSKNQHNKKTPGFEEADFESAVAIPFGAEIVEGVVLLRKHVAWPITEPELEGLEKLVKEFWVVFQAFQAGFDTGSHADRLELVSEVARTLSDSPYLEEVLQMLVHLTARRFNYRVVTVRLLDESSQELILRATQATNKAYQRKRAIRLDESIAGRAITSQKPVVVNDVMEDPEYVGHDLAEEQGLRSMVCIPLIVQGRPVGVMSCYTGERREFPPDELAVLDTLAKQAAVSVEHAKLQVKNTLMQEMHHRVKNNLQQVASLLRLQMRQSHYKTLEQALTDSLARIQAIASVHDLLSRDDLDHVSMKHIAETLGHHQQQSFIMPGKSIGFGVQGDDVKLNTSQATQVALVLNEMIQNAVEHGFAESNDGEIHISIEELEDEEVGLWVSNNGDPLPAEFDYMNAGQLGLQIIRSLTMALGGRFKMENRLGWTVCEVVFPRQSAE